MTKTIQRDKMGTCKRIVHKSKIRTLYFSIHEPFQDGIYIYSLIYLNTHLLEELALAPKIRDVLVRLA